MSKVSVAIVLGLASGCLQAQWITQKAVGIPRTADGKPDLSASTPKTHDGKPDLSGLWLLAPGSGGISQLKPSEMNAAAVTVRKEREESLGKDGPSTQCLPFGFLTAAGGNMVKVVQTPGLIVILSEDLEFRQIFTDGRDLPKDPNPAWMGYSVGHWDGDTLVVESTGYNERTWLEDSYPHTENLHITERIKRADLGHLTIEATWSDPKLYEKPWTTKINALFTPDTDLLEYVCAENNRDLAHLVGKHSDDTKNAVKVAPEILSKYVGTYLLNAKELGIPGPDFLPINIALEDGVLKLGMGDAAKQPVTPLSETVFTGFGGRIEFGRNDRGEVAYFVMKIAEGDFRLNKQK